MYVILVNEDNTLTPTKKERIMQRSKLFDNLWFLVNPIYKEYDISECTVLLEYVLPVSRKYCSEILTLSADRYKDHLKYVLPFDTNLTSEAGKIELQLTFLYANLDVDGSGIQRVRKTSTTCIDIVPISAWSDIVPDSALSALDQRIIKIDSQINALNNAAILLDAQKADDIEYNEENNTLQLLSGNDKIGTKVTLKCRDEEMLEDGVPIVDFGSGSSEDDDPDNPNPDNPEYDDDDVVEF